MESVFKLKCPLIVEGKEADNGERNRTWTCLPAGRLNRINVRIFRISLSYILELSL